MIFPQPVLPQSSQTLISTQKERPHFRCQGEFSPCFSLVTGNLANVTTAWHGVAPRHARPHSSRCGSACREASTAVSAALCQLRAFRTAAGKISARFTRCTTAAIHARQKPFALNVYIKESIRKEWKYSNAVLGCSSRSISSNIKQSTTQLASHVRVVHFCTEKSPQKNLEPSVVRLQEQ